MNFDNCIRYIATQDMPSERIQQGDTLIVDVSDRRIGDLVMMLSHGERIVTRLQTDHDISAVIGKVVEIKFRK